MLSVVFCKQEAADGMLISDWRSDVCSSDLRLLANQGRVVCIGMGKSGHIARKIAATFASTGTPAFYVHPGEAGPGDLGMITDSDVVLALSNSGETDALLMCWPVLKRQGKIGRASCGERVCQYVG